MFIDSERFWPSYNICPSSFVPVLVMQDRLMKYYNSLQNNNNNNNNSNDSNGDLVLHSMKWGLIPSFSKTSKGIGFRTINARIETIKSKPTYRRLVNSKRCIVLFQGYYEWKGISRKEKQPYFFTLSNGLHNYNADNEDKIMNNNNDTLCKNKCGRDISHILKSGDIIQNNECCELCSNNERKQNDSHTDICNDIFKNKLNDEPLMYMAALFDTWKDTENDKLLFSVSIVTKNANKYIEWCHERMPVILTKEQSKMWLNHENNIDQCIEMIQNNENTTNIKVHPVLREYVGNIKKKDEQCIQTLYQINKSKKKTGLHKFFKTAPKKQKQNQKQKIKIRQPIKVTFCFHFYSIYIHSFQ